MATATLTMVQDAGEDFEWYPTTQRMIDVVAQHIPADAGSIMDIGAGDGRVLTELAKRCTRKPDLYAIEKSIVLIQSQPENVVPVGTDFYEQNLTCLPVDYIFCNPPYSQFEAWARAIIESGYAKKAFLVIPRRWKESKIVAASLKRRGATSRVIHSDDFLDAERRARAVVDIVEVSYPRKDRRWEELQDPFDVWFDNNISTFDQAEKIKDDETGTDVAKVLGTATIGEMVAAYNDEYARMEENYRAIFKLDYAILKELGVNKEHVREGIKTKMAGLKNKYWHLLFERLDAITNRLATKTKARFLERLTGRASIAFTANNAYAVVLWAIKNANKYYDEQLIELFRDLSTFEGAMNYKSNQKTWQRDDWRYHRMNEEKSRPTRYALDYRIVLEKYQAIYKDSDGYGFGRYDYPGDLHRECHHQIADVIAVLYNLGFALYAETPSINRHWRSGGWQDFTMKDGRVLFQAKAHKNGNLHFRFMPEAIRALNVEAGRLLGWLRSPADVVQELGYTEDEAARLFRSNIQLGPSSVKLLPTTVSDAA